MIKQITWDHTQGSLQQPQYAVETSQAASYSPAESALIPKAYGKDCSIGESLGRICVLGHHASLASGSITLTGPRISPDANRRTVIQAPISFQPCVGTLQFKRFAPKLFGYKMNIHISLTLLRQPFINVHLNFFTTNEGHRGDHFCIDLSRNMQIARL